MFHAFLSGINNTIGRPATDIFLAVFHLSPMKLNERASTMKLKY